MTIKIKIILGFVALMLITIIASTVGYVGFEKATFNLSEVSRYTTSDAAASDLETNIARAYIELLKFIKDNSDESLEAIPPYIVTAQEKADIILANLFDPDTVNKVKETKKDITTFATLIEDVSQRYRKAYSTYDEIVHPSSIKVLEAYTHILNSASETGETKALIIVGHSLTRLVGLTASLARFKDSRDKKDSDQALNRIKSLKEGLVLLKPLLVTESGHKNYTEITASIDSIEKATQIMITANNNVIQKFAELEEVRQRMVNRASEINEFIAQQAEIRTKNAVQSNSAGQTQLFTTSIIGVVVGSALALVIILGLIRVLNDISGFATALARGDFTYTVKTKEKGEIGAMVAGIKQIPAVLQELIDGTIAGVKKMQVGHFKERLNAKAYSGSYAELVTAVNTVADTYTKILDEMPVPLLTADKSNTVYYTNEASESVLEGKLLEHYITEGESNFGINAIDRGENYTSEATFLKEEQSRTMAVTAVPLNGYDGNPAAFIEIVTDLTAIKNQQRIMLQVAEEATTISTRVAAASEEIAAQVEQVSRGAEVQRARVESTASAMTEMNATVIEVARSASEAAEQSDNTRVKAQEGETLVNQVMSSINQVNTVSQNLHSKMQDLGTQAENIGSVMNVISDIADQTNLLALNAAIEAARAGEAGRGFAVVADEVRKLAEKTMQATQEVGASITSVQDSARANIEEVTKAAVSIEEANQLANSSGQALNEIVNLASANSGIVTSIATAAEEQSATSDEISNAISEINTIVGETSEGMVQSSAAIQELSSMAQELQRVMSGLR